MNEEGIANLISIPMLEADGCKVSMTTKKDWIVRTPAGKEIVFKRESGVYKGMPYIDLREHMSGFALIETIEGNIDKFRAGGGSDDKIKKAV